MSTDITLSSASRANLLMLRENSSLFGMTQERLATGKKVNNALDDAMKYFSAQAHTREAKGLDDVKSEMNEASTLLKITEKTLDSAIKTLDQMRGLAKSWASADSATQAAIVNSLNEMSTQIDQLLKDGTYNGKNILTTATGTSAIDIPLNNAGTPLVVNGFGADQASASPFLTQSTFAAADFALAPPADPASVVEAALKSFKAAASQVSSTYSIVSIRIDFTTSMIANFQNGAAQLVEADSNEEGANLLALQTRNQLGVSGLSMASQQAQAVLKLF